MAFNMSPTQATAAGGGLAGVLSGLFGSGDAPNPSDSANQYLSQIPGQIKPLYQPSINAGNAALPGYQQKLQELMSNPQKLMQMLGQSYQKSPGYDWNVSQAQQGANNAAAAGGMAGTQQNQQLSAEATQGIASKDYNQYMDQIMKMFGLGLGGTGGLVEQGNKSSGALADSLAQILGQQGQYAYAGQAAQNAADAQSKSNLWTGLDTLAGVGLAPFTGGASLALPAAMNIAK